MKKWFKEQYFRILRLVRNWCNNQIKSENDRQSRKIIRELDARRKAIVKLQQENCPHLAGYNDLSEVCDYRTSIVWHTDNLGETFGLCTNCQREFREADADYSYWRKKLSFNIPSAANSHKEVYEDPSSVSWVPREVTLYNEPFNEKWGW